MLQYITQYIAISNILIFLSGVLYCITIDTIDSVPSIYGITAIDIVIKFSRPVHQVGLQNVLIP